MGVGSFRLCRWRVFGLSIALFDESVVRAAGQDFFVGIGQGLAATRPGFLAVVGLAAVTGHGAAREGAAAVAGMQNDALPR